MIDPAFWGGAVVGGGLGFLLFLLLFPVARKITRSYINKHKQEVTLLTDDIADFIQEMELEESRMSEKDRGSYEQKNRPKRIIEIDDS